MSYYNNNNSIIHRRGIEYIHTYIHTYCTLQVEVGGGGASMRYSSWSEKKDMAHTYSIYTTFLAGKQGGVSVSGSQGLRVSWCVVRGCNLHT